MNKTSRLRIFVALTVGLGLILAACSNPTKSSRPSAFTFDTIEDAALSTPVTSETVTLTGFTGTLTANITGGTLYVNGDEETTPTKVSSGDRLYVVVTSSDEYETTTTATITVGTYSTTFSVTTAAEEPTTPTAPDAFTFETVTDAALSTPVTSETVTLTGFTGTLTANITGGTLYVNGDEATTPTNVSPGDEIYVVVTSSDQYETTTTAEIEVGTYDTTFGVVTAAEEPTTPTAPDAFTFETVTDAALSTPVTSETVTLTGFTGTLTANITGGTLYVNGDEATTPTNVSPGDEIYVVVTSSDQYETTTTAEIEVGTYDTTFEVVTVAELAITAFGTADIASPDETITLSWSITGPYDVLELTSNIGPDPVIIDDNSATVVIPTGTPTVTFTLSVSDSDSGQDASTDETIEIELWVCEPGSSYDIADYVPDADLLAALRAAPGIPPAGEISCDQMKALTTFSTGTASGDHGTITSLVGIQHASNLEQLYAQRNEIGDLRPISGLLALELINFDQNRILDLSPLADLTNLVEIGFWDNGPEFNESQDGIEDISVLENLPNLEVVYLSDNNISDLTPLSGLDNLRVLYVVRNNISDLSPLANKTNLRSLRVGYQFFRGSITDGSVFATLPNLSWLDLAFTSISDVSFLEDLDQLFAVRLAGMRLENIDALLNNANFPDTTVDRSELGDNVPEDPMLDVTLNCLDTTDGSPTQLGIAALSAAGVQVIGYAEELQDLCGAGLISPDLMNEAFEQMRQSEGYR